MLFTRCPNCDTNFRVTEEALAKAAGQVRCGRCAGVFDAYAELRETADAGANPADSREAAPAGAPSPASAAMDAPAGSAPAMAPSSRAPSASPRRAETPARQAEPPPPERHANRAEDGVVEHSMRPAQTTAIWTLENSVERPTSRWWTVATAAAIVALAVQVVHHFRFDLAARSSVGTWVQRAYTSLGTPLTPNWDPKQYQILDWVATAEPNARGQGSLQITATIHNRGPQPQPYPHIHLQLKDRWEEIVGSRFFRPSEYLDAGSAEELMRAGDTARAEIKVVDPGPDAYGFELDVCVEAEADALTCGNDEIFL